MCGQLLWPKGQVDGDEDGEDALDKMHRARFGSNEEVVNGLS